MDAGLAGHVSAEFLRTLLTGVPIFLGAVVLLTWQSARWRNLLWLRCSLGSTKEWDDVLLTPRWCGWTVTTPTARVELVGGFAGCRWRVAGGRWERLPVDGRGSWRELCAMAQADNR